METVTLTREEYKKEMFEAYKKGFAAAVDTLSESLKAVNEIILLKEKKCITCGGYVNVSSGYAICERGCGGPVV